MTQLTYGRKFSAFSDHRHRHRYQHFIFSHCLTLLSLFPGKLLKNKSKSERKRKLKTIAEKEKK